MKKPNLEHKALRPVRKTSGFTESGPNEPVSKVESRVSAWGVRREKIWGNSLFYRAHRKKPRFSIITRLRRDREDVLLTALSMREAIMSRKEELRRCS